MAVATLYFDVRDEEYFTRLKEYIRLNYGRYFRISENKPEDGAFYTVSDYINRRNRKDLFLIKEEKGDACKYEKASSVCIRMAKAFGAVSSGFDDLREKRTGLVCVTSAGGGAGKTTVSQAMACEYSRMGRKTLYINANPYSAEDGIFVESDKNAFSLLRYHLGKGESSGLWSIASRSPERRTDFIANKRPSPDGFITAGEAGTLISGLASYPYDIIVLDIPSYHCAGHMKLMKNALCNFLVKGPNGDPRHEALRQFLGASNVPVTAEVTNFSDGDSLCVPSSDRTGGSMTPDFLDAVKRLCVFAEDNHGTV